MGSLTIYQFMALGEDDKIVLLDEHGVYLDVYRRSKGCKVALFKLWNFYCEVWFQRKTNKILDVNAFSSYKKLDMYLDQIDINSIYT